MLAYLRGPAVVSGWIVGAAGGDPFMIMLLLVVLFVIVGDFIDAIPAIIIFMPIITSTPPRDGQFWGRHDDLADERGPGSDRSGGPCAYISKGRGRNCVSHHAELVDHPRDAHGREVSASAASPPVEAGCQLPAQVTSNWRQTAEDARHLR